MEYLVVNFIHFYTSHGMSSIHLLRLNVTKIAELLAVPMYLGTRKITILTVIYLCVCINEDVIKVVK